jgi:hypothetical protein
MSADISSVMQEWPFDPQRINARIVPGDDGRPKLQLRLDLGLMQMELDGRPDGQRPEGRESWLEVLEARRALAGEDGEFELAAEDCARLQAEAVQYYHRYLSLAHLEDWARVKRDTERNLRCFEFVERHASSAEVAWGLRQFTPFVEMMRTRAAAMLELGAERVGEAVRLVDAGIGRIEEFLRGHVQEEDADDSAELRSLREWREELRERLPMDPRDRLRRKLAAAVEREAYEEAARLRDELAELERTRT